MVFTDEHRLIRRPTTNDWRAQADMSELQTSMPTTLVSSDPRRSFLRAAAGGAADVPGGVGVAAAIPDFGACRARRALGHDCVPRRRKRRLARRCEIASSWRLVDMQAVPPGEERAFRGLVEQLTARDGPLVAVCGNPNDDSGEVWSRQLGVWMYLPGVDSESDLALVCSEAQEHRREAVRKAPEGVK